MGFRTVGLLAILSVSLCLAQDEEPRQPLVAFMCNKPAMYLTDDGWMEDRTTDCIQEPNQILEYCRKVYPEKEITNVVESNELVTIDNWCGFDASRCHHHNQHTVRPFRCLVGPFQSDALLVPEHCLFDHVHGAQCARYMTWNHTAAHACSNHSMRLDSFAMLQPCMPEVNLFNGVEFVCCPDPSIKKGDKAYIVEDDSDILPAEDSSFWQPQPKDAKSDPNAILPERKTAKPFDAKPSENDVYAKYITGDRGAEFYNEHEFFVKAKGDMAKHHHERVASMMKDWAAARQRIADVRAIDEKGADQLEKEMTERFQKTYEALEQEAVEEKQQMSAIHQQRVEKELNDKKRDNLENFMDELTKKKKVPTATLR